MNSYEATYLKERTPKKAKKTKTKQNKQKRYLQGRLNL